MAAEALEPGTGPEVVNDDEPQTELRQRWPALGLRQARQLLARTAGDVAAAGRLFEEHAVATVAQRAGVDTATAASRSRRRRLGIWR